MSLAETDAIGSDELNVSALGLDGLGLDGLKFDDLLGLGDDSQSLLSTFGFLKGLFASDENKNTVLAFMPLLKRAVGQFKSNDVCPRPKPIDILALKNSVHEDDDENPLISDSVLNLVHELSEHLDLDKIAKEHQNIASEAMNDEL